MKVSGIKREWVKVQRHMAISFKMTHCSIILVIKSENTTRRAATGAQGSLESLPKIGKTSRQITHSQTVDKKLSENKRKPSQSPVIVGLYNRL